MKKKSSNKNNSIEFKIQWKNLLTNKENRNSVIKINRKLITEFLFFYKV